VNISNLIYISQELPINIDEDTYDTHLQKEIGKQLGLNLD